MHDHRQIKRWQISWQAKLKLKGAESFTNCKINDINLKGLKLCLAQRLHTDTFLKFNLALSKECILENVEVWIVWHKCTEGINSYGLYFSRISDQCKEKIYRFIRQYYPEQLDGQWWQKEKGGEQMEDHRIFERFNADMPLRFLELDGNREGTARTKDISAKGMGIICKEQLKSRTPLEVWLEIPDKGEPLYARGEVVWARQQGLDEYRMGIHLEKANLMGLSRVMRAV